MQKLAFPKLAMVTCIALLTATSCSKTTEVQPAPEITASTDLSHSLTTSATGKISVAGTTLLLGINGHPLGDAPYTSTPATKQIQLIKGMGMSWYRFDVQSTSTGAITVPELSNPLITAAEAGGVKLLPMLYPRTLDLSATESASYQAGKTLGANFAEKNGTHFSYYELGNDLELKILLPNKTGASQADYDSTKFKVMAAYLKGMDEGIKLKDPGAKTMISAGWLHYGFLRMLDWYGVNFDVVAYNWYSEMEKIAPNAPYYISDITVKLASLFPSKPIWITETNLRYKAVSTAEQDQNTFLSNFIAKCQNNSQVKVLLIYELFNEPDKNTLEGNYGIIKWTNPYTDWAKKLVANNLTVN